jgi:hypothetical protein
VLAKLKEQFARLQEKYPEVAAELGSIVRANLQQPQPQMWGIT